MNCNQCVKVNPLPSCIDTTAFELYGLTFPDYTEQTIVARFRDTATGRITYFDLEIDINGNVISFDIASVFDLSDHIYEIKFVTQTSGSPAAFTLTNEDDTTVSGCCVEFSVNVGLAGSDGFFLSNLGCAATDPSSGGNASDYMLIADYDPDHDGCVTCSDTVGGLSAAELLDLANHTGELPISSITDLQTELDTFQTITNLGVTYAPLVGGLVPLINLPPGSPNQYKGLYNANTNTPTLTNGVGTAGDFYIANVAGSGGPAGTLAISEIAVYDGAVWQSGPAFTSGIAQITTDAGVQVGPNSTINTTAHMAPIGDRLYLSAAQLASIPSGASGLDQLVKTSDLGAPVGTSYITPQQYGAINASSTFASLGITQPTIDATYPGIGAVTTDTVDWAAITYAANLATSSGKRFETYGTYYVNRGIVVDIPDYETEWTWEGNGARINTTNSNTFTVISIGIPADQTEAMLLVNNTYKINNLKVYCDSDQTGFIFGPSYSSVYSQLLVFNADNATGIIARFNLNSTFNSCNIRDCLYGIRLESGFGHWTLATTSNSQCNVSTINSGRVSWQSVVVDGEVGFDIIDSSNVTLNDCIVEGSRVKQGISLRSQLTTVQTFEANNFHYECVDGTDVAGTDQAAFYARTLGAMCTLTNFFGQYDAILADTGLSAGGASTTLILQRTKYWLDKSGRAFNNDGNTTYVSYLNDGIFHLSASWPALIAGTAVTLCGGIGCGNNKYSHYPIPR